MGGGATKHRIIVCTHWLLGLCHHGTECSFLHRFDKTKMKPCKHGNLCKIKNCPLKHVAEEELEECIFYKQGFCCNGPKCARRHIKRMPEDCPAEVTFDPTSNQYAGALAIGGPMDKKMRTMAPNDNFKVTLCTHFLLNFNCPFGDKCHYAHGEDEVNEGYQPNVEMLSDAAILDPTFNQLGESLEELPFPVAVASSNKVSYFLLQSPDLRSLAIAQRRGVWQVSERISMLINESFKTSQHVILFFCVRPLRGVYGVARMESPVPPTSPIPNMTGEFSIKWLRSVRVGLKTIAQIKLGNGTIFVGRTVIDSRFESKVGFDMLLICYRKSSWNWLADVARAEATIHLVNDAPVPNSTLHNEYYPTQGLSAYMLPPDQLFAPEWIEWAGLVILTC
jgi:cleavage and polyadenylation specificity factor subunit 4